MPCLPVTYALCIRWHILLITLTICINSDFQPPHLGRDLQGQASGYGYTVSLVHFQEAPFTEAMMNVPWVGAVT